MIEDVALEGLGWDDKENHKGVPYPMCNVEELVSLVAPLEVLEMEDYGPSSRALIENTLIGHRNI